MLLGQLDATKSAIIRQVILKLENIFQSHRVYIIGARTISGRGSPTPKGRKSHFYTHIDRPKMFILPIPLFTPINRFCTNDLYIQTRGATGGSDRPKGGVTF